MIERILPATVSVASARSDTTGRTTASPDTESTAGTEYADDADDAEHPLFPEEEAFIAASVPQRRREFAEVRGCARRALAAIGVPPAPILPDRRGAPGWPGGVVGSMTHCAGYRAAAVAAATDLGSLGIDAEPHKPLPDGVPEAVARPEELRRLSRLRDDDPAVHWDLILFSAKESVFKAWYPLTGRSLDFTEASLTFSRAGGFRAELLVPGPVVRGVRRAAFDGRWLVADGFALTAVVVA